MRRLIAIRKRYPVFGRGTIEFLHPTNLAVLAYIRCDEDQTILVVNNLSRFVQPVELDLRQFVGQRPGRAVRRNRLPADRRERPTSSASGRTPSTGFVWNHWLHRDAVAQQGEDAAAAEEGAGRSRPWKPSQG